MVTVVRQRLPHALRSTHSVTIHSEKSDATKGRCPGRCQEAHRPHSDAYRLGHLVRFSLAPLEVASFGAGAFRIFLSASQPLVFIAAGGARYFPKLLRFTPKESPAMGPGFPPVYAYDFTLVRAKSNWKCVIASVAILRRLEGRVE